MKIKTNDNTIIDVQNKGISKISKLFYELSRDFDQNEPISIDISSDDLKSFIDFCESIKYTEIQIKLPFLQNISDVKNTLFKNDKELIKFYEEELDNQAKLLKQINIASYLMSNSLEDIINLKVTDIITSDKGKMFFNFPLEDQKTEKKDSNLKDKYISFCDIINTLSPEQVDKYIELLNS